MRNRRRSSWNSSLFDRLRWRFVDPPVGSAGGGPASSGAPAPTPDVPPVNGGPDRDFDSMSNATIDVPSTPAGGGGAGSAGASGGVRTPADPNQASGVTQPQANAQQAQWTSIRDAAQARGFRFDPTVTDDHSALEFLLAQAGRNQQADIHAQLGRQLAPHASRIQQFLGQNGQPQQSPAPERPAWEAPPFDNRWLSLVDRDRATGLFIAKPGVQPEIAQAVNAYAEWKDKFDQNPAAVINAQIDHRAREIADARFAERWQETQRESTIQSIVQENQHFLFQVDQNGQRQFDYRGQPIVTPLGAAYLQQLQIVTNAGVKDPRLADTMAKNLVRGQYAAGQLSQGQQQQQQTANPGTQQSFANPNVNPAQANGSQQRRVDPAATDPSEEGLSLAQRLQLALKSNGVTDQDVYDSVTGGA